MFSLNKKLDSNLRDILVVNNTGSYRVLIKYKNFQDSISKKITSLRGVVIRKIESCNIICAKLNSKSLERLIEYPEIEYICLDQYFNLCGMSVSTGNKVRFSNNFSITGKGVGVGIIDSGVYPHGDLTYPQNRIALFVDLINDLSHPYDDNGHGSCTSGIIAGNGESSNKIYCGVAPSCSIYCFKAFDKLGKGFVSDVLFAIQELINASDKYNIKVLCLPFESLYFNKFIYNAFNTLLKKAIANSIVPILPSGSNRNDDNSITGISLSPNCITVSGIDTTKGEIKCYDYSSCGNDKKTKKPDFCAACVDIISLNSNTSYYPYKSISRVHAPKLDASYRSFTGTSVAAAYIAGLCTLLFEFNPNLNFNDIVSLLKVSSISLELPKNEQGEGRVNINKVFNKSDNKG